MPEDLVYDKYKFLKTQLKMIIEKLQVLEDNYEQLQAIMKETILIDQRMIEEDQLKNTSVVVKDIMNELNSKVIASIDNKM